MRFWFHSAKMCSLYYIRGTSIRILTLIWFVLLFCYFCFYIFEKWVKITFSSYFVYFIFLVLCLEVYERELKLRNKHGRNIHAYSTHFTASGFVLVSVFISDSRMWARMLLSIEICNNNQDYDTNVYVYYSKHIIIHTFEAVYNEVVRGWIL